MHMPRRSRRGFTLIELLVSLIMLVIVGGALYKLLVTVQRVSGRQTEVSNLQGNLRAGVQFVQSELGELASNAAGASSDIVSMSATNLRYKAMRGLGETCEITATGVKVQRGTYSGAVPIAGRDRLWFLWDHDSTLVADDTWHDLAITDVAASTCPDGTTPSMTLSVTLTAHQVDSTYAPSPVRTWEEMEIGPVTVGGQLWLGVRSISHNQDDLLPLAGPLAAGGLAFEYREADGSVTANPNWVKIIRVTLIGATDRQVHKGVGGAMEIEMDTLQVRIQLRNSR
jgi:prepilin-type N-terminal cleavage/methylation domain-containing protein